MKLTQFETKFITQCTWRDLFNLTFILSVIALVRRFEFINLNGEYWVYIVFPIMIFGVMLLLRVWLIKPIEIFIFQLFGKWYCPQCDLKHKRNYSLKVSCNRQTSQNLTDQKTQNINCNVALQGIWIPETQRKFKYNLILWGFLRMPFYGEPFNSQKKS
jgi:hypothetical protein